MAIEAFHSTSFIRQVTFRQLQVFYVVAKCGSFTAASERLYLTQPTVSAQMKKLAETIGHELFEQVGRKIYLTDAGEKLVPTCEAVFASMNQFEQDLAQTAHTESPTFNVVATRSIESHAPLLISLLKSEFPNVRISLTVMDYQALFARIGENKDHFYLIDGELETEPLVKHTLFRNALLVVAHPSHRLSKGSSVSLADLSKEDFIAFERDTAPGMLFETLQRKYGFRPQICMTLGNIDAVKHAVSKDLGIAVVPEITVADEIASGEIAKINVAEFPIYDDWYIAYRRGKTLDPLATEILNYLVEHGESNLLQRS